MEKKNFNDDNRLVSALEFVQNSFAEFKNTSDYQERVHHIANGLVIRLTWDGEYMSTEIYDDKFRHIGGDASNDKEFAVTLEALKDDIINFYDEYVEHQVENNQDIFLPGCSILWDKRKKQYYIPRFEDGKRIKEWVDVYSYANEQAKTYNRFWFCEY